VAFKGNLHCDSSRTVFKTDSSVRLLVLLVQLLLLLVLVLESTGKMADVRTILEINRLSGSWSGLLQQMSLESVAV